jgi:hypothetical protein
MGEDAPSPQLADEETAMSPADTERPEQVYKIECEDGCRYVVYNAAAIGNPPDHVPDKWYVRPYGSALPLGEDVNEPFETAADAERAARALHVRGPGAPRLARSSGPDHAGGLMPY